MSRRILVVDDVPERVVDVEEELRFSFRGHDIEVIGAYDMLSAERIFQEALTEGHPFTVVLLDLRLPPSKAVLKDIEDGGAYLLRKFAQQAPKTVYILSSGSPASIPMSLPADLPPENYRCIPKTAPRERLVQCLREALRLPR